MAVNINTTEFVIQTDTSLMESGTVFITCDPVDETISEFLVRIVIRNMTRFTTIYTEQFNNIAPGVSVTAAFRPEELIKDSTFNITVQVKATLNNMCEEIIQRDFFVIITEYHAAANIVTNNVAIRYNTVHNSYFITAEAILSYSGYESLRILCIIRDAVNTLLLENYINYTADPNNIHRIAISQDFAALGFPASWYLQNPCSIRLSYEYI